MRYKILPDGDLLLTAGNRDRLELAYEACNGYQAAEIAVAEAYRDRLHFIQPEAIGALTDAPILTTEADYSDEVLKRFHGPEPYPDAPVWWFPDYAIRDPWKELAHKGRVVFARATESA